MELTNKMSIHLTLEDNKIKELSDKQLSQQSQIHAYRDLQTVAGKSLQELCKQNANLLVFPDCLKSGDDKIEGRPGSPADRALHRICACAE